MALLIGHILLPPNEIRDKVFGYRTGVCGSNTPQYSSELRLKITLFMVDIYV